MKTRMKNGSIKILLHALLIVVSFISAYPFFVMISGSFKTINELLINSFGLPQNPTLDNYIKLLTYNSGAIARSYLNAIFICTIYTLLTLLCASMAGYAFSKYRFPGRNVLFVALLFTMMVPMEVNIAPMYLMFSKMKWLNTYWVQIFPGIANVFAMFMCRSNMDSVPDSLLEAARIDGAKHLRVYTDIMLPASAPAIGALAILTFLGKWNDYLLPKMMVNKPRYMTIMVILPTLRVEDGNISMPWDIVLAGCSLVVIPLLVVFLIFQDKFLSSVTIGAVKG